MSSCVCLLGFEKCINLGSEHTRMVKQGFAQLQRIKDRTMQTRNAPMTTEYRLTPDNFHYYLRTTVTLLVFDLTNNQDTIYHDNN